jgi:zinc-ribbon domain
MGRMSSCASCGSKLLAESRFCPQCGASAGLPSGETAVQELPPSETGPVPVDPFVAERRFFGVPPSTLLFGLGVGAITLAILLLVIGHYVWGLLLFVLAALVLALFVSQTRRLPAEASSLARASLAALDAVRARAGAAVETVAAQGSARMELAGLRRELSGLTAARSDLLRELGGAVYEGDRTATRELKKRIQELDDETHAKEEQMSKVAQQASERIGEAQLQVQPTQILPRDEEAPEPSQAPEPARVPEPFPPPDEGEPPQPVQVPEPFPPPDEGDRPQQPSIPEPGPE